MCILSIIAFYRGRQRHLTNLNSFDMVDWLCSINSALSQASSHTAVIELSKQLPFNDVNSEALASAIRMDIHEVAKKISKLIGKLHDPYVTSSITFNKIIEATQA